MSRAGIYNIAMRVLFVCTGNSCRSPMAERLGRLMFPALSFESAGVMPAQAINPFAVKVLQEYGADAEGFTPRHVERLDLYEYGQIVLIGETAQLLCQTPDGPDDQGRLPRVHLWDMDDPYEVTGPDEIKLAAYLACAHDLEGRIAALVNGAA
jgi:protein-tyrosine-phosphatase